MASVTELPLNLTSPHMRGPVVRMAQEVLDSQNIFNGDYLKGGKIDGEFGPWTHRATKRAKFWLGYAALDGSYGQTLHNYLTGKTRLPEKNRKLRAQRLADRNAQGLGDRIWAEAGKDVARRLKEEPPYSNRNYITEDVYKLIGPWCAMGASVWSAKAGSKVPILGRSYNGRYHYCPTIFNDAFMGVNGLSLVKPLYVRRGDWVLFDWGDDKQADHVGIFGSWETMASVFHSREGNTSYEGSGGSQSDGGAAAARTRSINDVARNGRGDYGFVRLGR